jgi:hypothetical protein
MKIDLNDPNQLLSHLLLEDAEVAKAVSKTLTSSYDNVTPTVQFNGVDMQPETLERVLKHFMKCVENDLMNKYSNVELEVQRRLEERVQKEAKRITLAMEDFIHSIEDARSIIKPYWEKD